LESLFPHRPLTRTSTAAKHFAGDCGKIRPTTNPHMAQKTATQIAGDVQFDRWLYWQMLRRSCKYRLGVAAFLKLIRKRRTQLRRQIEGQSRSRRFSNSQEFEVWGRLLEKKGLLDAFDCILRTYRLLNEHGRVRTTEELKRLDTMRSALYEDLRSSVMQMISECRRHCVRFGDPKLLPANLVMEKAPGEMLLPGEPRSIVPELDDFSKKWGLVFPVPPRFPAALEQVFTSKTSLIHPVRIQEGENTLRLEIKLGLPKRLLVAFVDGALHHFVPHTKGWKTVSLKRPHPAPSAREEITVKRTRTFVQVEIALHRGQVRSDKNFLLECIGKQLPSPGRSLRLRKEELQEMFLIVDDLKRRPRPTRISLAKKHFPKTGDIHLIRQREKRYGQLQACYDFSSLLNL
jgi:hypothetical protein